MLTQRDIDIYRVEAEEFALSIRQEFMEMLMQGRQQQAQPPQPPQPPQQAQPQQAPVMPPPPPV